MNRKELKALGLTDEQVEAVIKDHVKVVQDLNEKSSKQIEANKAKISELEKEKEQLEKSAGNDDELKKSYEELKAKYDSVNDELNTSKRDTLLSDAIQKAKGTDADYIKYLLGDLELAEDGQSLVGLDEKMKQIQEANPKYFKQDNEDNNNNNHAEGFKIITNDLGQGNAPSEVDAVTKQVNEALGIK